MSKSSNPPRPGVIPNKPYVLGHSRRELDRLELQGLIYRDVTRRALLDGRLTTGMRVLDIGCDSGDVSRLAAEIVGPSGSHRRYQTGNTAS